MIDISEEVFHLLIIACPSKFGIKEIKYSSFNFTPDIIALDFNNNTMNIELEVSLHTLGGHVNKGHFENNKISHCLYLENNMTANAEKLLNERINGCILTKIELDNADKIIMDQICTKLSIDFAIKQIIQNLMCANNEFQQDITKLIDYYFTKIYNETILEKSLKHVGMAITYNEIGKFIQRMPRNTIIRLINEYEILQKLHFDGAGYSFGFIPQKINKHNY
jgi:hypothetical protein